MPFILDSSVGTRPTWCIIPKLPLRHLAAPFLPRRLSIHRAPSTLPPLEGPGHRRIQETSSPLFVVPQDFYALDSQNTITAKNIRKSSKIRNVTNPMGSVPSGLGSVPSGLPRRVNVKIYQCIVESYQELWYFACRTQQGVPHGDGEKSRRVRAPSAARPRQDSDVNPRADACRRRTANRLLRRQPSLARPPQHQEQ